MAKGSSLPRKENWKQNKTKQKNNVETSGRKKENSKQKYGNIN